MIFFGMGRTTQFDQAGRAASQTWPLQRELRRRSYEIDVLNVILDGTPRQHQSLRDLGIGQAAGDRSKYLHLSTFANLQVPGRTATPNSPPAANGLDDCTHSICIKPSSPCLSLEAINGTRRSDGSAVWRSSIMRLYASAQARTRDDIDSWAAVDPRWYPVPSQRSWC